jgi:hypothetical protein
MGVMTTPAAAREMQSERMVTRNFILGILACGKDEVDYKSK